MAILLAKDSLNICTNSFYIIQKLKFQFVCARGSKSEALFTHSRAIIADSFKLFCDVCSFIVSIDASSCSSIVTFYMCISPLYSNDQLGVHGDRSQPHNAHFPCLVPLSHNPQSRPLIYLFALLHHPLPLFIVTSYQERWNKRHIMLL